MNLTARFVQCCVSVRAQCECTFGAGLGGVCAVLRAQPCYRLPPHLPYDQWRYTTTRTPPRDKKT